MKRAKTKALPKKNKAAHRADAFRLLGITEESVSTASKIEPLMKAAGVMERLWTYLETSSDPISKILIAQKYKLMNATQRAAVPFEAYCVAAGIDTKKALGLIVSEVYTQNEQAALLMAASAQPTVVKATIKAAELPSGSREREMLHKHSGFVPVPKTSVVVVKGGGNVIGNQTNQTVSVLPPIEQHVRQVSDRFNERKAIESPVVDIEPADDDEEGGD